MRIADNQILIKADMDQKQSITSGGAKFWIVPNRHTYEQNGIDTNPCVAEVDEVGWGVPLFHGDLIILHHNLIMDKAYQIKEGLSTIPYDRWVLAVVDKSNGELIAMPGNIICERIEKPGQRGEFYIPMIAIECYHDRVKVLHSGMGEIGDGEIIGILKYADYGVSYVWNGEIRNRCVVWVEDVVCTIKQENND